jgi:hypothetical protein
MMGGSLRSVCSALGLLVGSWSRRRKRERRRRRKRKRKRKNAVVKRGKTPLEEVESALCLWDSEITQD